MWDIEFEYIEGWLDGQDNQTIALIFAAFEVLASEGPNLGRPLVDTVKGSCLANLKELRPASTGNSEVRILFAFDPRRKAIMLLAGDKSKGDTKKQKWSGWYRKAIPQAEMVYERHLEQLRRQNG